MGKWFASSGFICVFLGSAHAAPNDPAACPNEAAIRAAHPDGGRKLAGALAEAGCRKAARTLFIQLQRTAESPLLRWALHYQSGQAMAKWCDLGCTAKEREAGRADLLLVIQQTTDAQQRAAAKTLYDRMAPPPEPKVEAPPTVAPVAVVSETPVVGVAQVSDSTRESGMDALSWTLIGGGGAAIIGGVVATVAYSKWEEFNDSAEGEHADYSSNQGINLALMGLGYLGGAGLITWGLLREPGGKGTSLLIGPGSMGFVGTW